MSKYEKPSNLQKAIDQIGQEVILERYQPKGMKLHFCQIHGAFLSHYSDKNPECTTCREMMASNEGNGTTATQVEHFINIRDMIAPPHNPHC